MLTYHHEHHADLTVAVQQYDLQMPYGIIECEDIFVRHLAEKPTLKFLVNAGIYLLEPTVYSLIPNGERYDMTDLIQGLLNEGRQVVAFPLREYWMDIGQHADYQQVKEHVRDWKPSS
jgi:NDP-sugar pyrophosphorylase family protein